MIERKNGFERRGRSSKGASARARKIKSVAVTLRHVGREEIASDVMGSYTGTPENGGVPEQDADDL